MSWIDRLNPTDHAAMTDAGRIGPERRPGGIRTIYRAPDEEVIGQWPNDLAKQYEEAYGGTGIEPYQAEGR